MNVKESCDIRSNSPSVLDLTVDNIVQVLKNQEEEVQELLQKKLMLEVKVEVQKRNIQQLELAKAEINAEVTTLKLRNVAYQKEHTNLRNAITVVKFQIDKIKESIAKAKANDLRHLEDFEKAVDEITEKFRSGPDVYDRKILLVKIAAEREKNSLLLEKLKEVKNSYENFNKENGLRTRRDESEELLDCILPDSESSCLIETTKTLDEVIRQIKKLSRGTKQDSKDLSVPHVTK